MKAYLEGHDGINNLLSGYENDLKKKILVLPKGKKVLFKKKSITERKKKAS